MIRFDQSLRIARLVVLKSGGALYDEEFHAGVNIIRGENSSGKSTIADFIFFALGGDVADWTPEAASADSVHAEVVLGGVTYTLAREVEQDSRPPIYFFEGPFADAMANRNGWLRYPHRRTSNTESFSQVLFRLLRMPEQRTDAQQNVTMHQILRLLYGDQTTPFDQIFRQERFDTRDLRTGVAELLLGFDDLELHDLRLQIRDLDRVYGELVGELRSIIRVLGKTSDSDITIADFQKQLEEIDEERQSLLTIVEELSSKRDKAARAKASGKLEKLAKELGALNEQLNEARQNEHDLLLDIEDSTRFVETLNERIHALDSSKGVADFLGEVKFSICPACLSPLEEQAKEGACHLCKRNVAEGFRSGHLKMREELVFQVRESAQLLEGKKGALAKLKEKGSQLSSERKRLIADLSEFERRVDPLDAEIANHQRRVGYLDRSAEDLARKTELAKLVKSKMAERDNTAADLSRLRERLEMMEETRQKRQGEVSQRINELCVEALHADLPVEEAFRDASRVEFSFAHNRLSVDGRSRFSASSATYLKNAFLFSLFEISLEDPAVRWPRFILLDNIEDKGMQPNRSANFQEYVVRRSHAHDVEYQVIITTSMISPNLEDSAMCVGPHYTKDRKTLAFARPQSAAAPEEQR